MFMGPSQAFERFLSMYSVGWEIIKMYQFLN